MDASQVLSCAVEQCAYNKNRECHASGISVGGDHALCDTFTTQVTGVGMSSETTSSVKMCHADVCKFNKEMSCMAPGISVGNHMEHADCVTYVPKS